MIMPELDPQLARDCFVIQENDFAWLLLMNNAAVPWFIVVPKVEVVEYCDLNTEQQAQLNNMSNLLCDYIREHYPVNKLNVAAIGNVVTQLHWHIVGRFEDDYCWPGVVWGQAVPKRYTEEDVRRIKGEIRPIVN